MFLSHAIGFSCLLQKRFLAHSVACTPRIKIHKNEKTLHRIRSTACRYVHTRLEGPFARTLLQKEEIRKFRGIFVEEIGVLFQLKSLIGTLLPFLTRNHLLKCKSIRSKPKALRFLDEKQGRSPESFKEHSGLWVTTQTEEHQRDHPRNTHSLRR